MGRGAEILLLPLGAMTILAVAAVFAAFFHWKFARLCAGAALGLASLFLLVLLPMNDWNPFHLLGLLLVGNPIMAFLFVTLLLSAIAIWAPLCQSGAADVDGQPVPVRPRWWLLGGFAASTAAVVGYGAAQVIAGHRGEEKTKTLLAGDPTVRLRELRIDYQQRQVVCTDPEVLRYLEGRLRDHDPDPNYLGTTYLLSLSYEGGGTQAFASYWADSGDFNLLLGEPGEGGKGHGIRLTQPQPRGVKELVSFLAQPNSEAAGKILHLGEGDSRIGQFRR